MQDRLFRSPGATDHFNRSFGFVRHAYCDRSTSEHSAAGRFGRFFTPSRAERTGSDTRPTRYQLDQLPGHPELARSPGASWLLLVRLHNPSIGKCPEGNPS